MTNDQNKDFYRSLYEHSMDAVLYTAPDGRVLAANPAACRLFNYTEADICALGRGGLVDPESPQLARMLEERQRTGSSQGELTFIRKDATRFVGWFSSSVFSDEAGHPRSVIIVRDLTEIKEKESALHQSIHEFEDLYNHAPCGYHSLDADGRIVKINQTELNWIGYGRDEVIGKAFRELLTPDSRPSHRMEFERFKQVGFKKDMELGLVHKDGHTVPVLLNSTAILDESGHFLMSRSVLTDMTTQKQLDRVIEGKLLELQTIMDGTNVAITLVKNRRQMWANRRMAELFGYSQAEMANQTTSMFYLSDEDYEGLGAKAYPRLAHGGIFQTEIEMRHRDGKTLWIDISGKAISPSDLSLGSIWVLQDITARKQAEEQAEKLHRQLLHAQKLESLGVLAGGIAHDFNNILAVIMGHADMAGRKGQGNPLEAQKHYHTIVNAAEKAADLCRQLLAYSGQGQVMIQPIDLSKLVQSLIKVIDTSRNKDVLLRLSLMDGLPEIEADTSQVQQIIMNLITNANEAMDNRSGVISISTGATYVSHEYLQQCFLPGTAEPGNYVFLEVSDTGCGMDSEALCRIFDPFFTTKFTGRGLGLSALLGIVRSQNGAVKVDSELGHGSSFRILFPAVDPLPEPSAEGISEADRANDNPLSFLVVDDEAAVREMAAMLLKNMGYNDVMVAASGQEAIDIYRKEMNRISLVLLDLTMPQMDGEETYRQLRSVNPDVKVILSSGYSLQSIGDRFHGKGLCGFLQKPYLQDALQQTIRNAISDDHQ